MEAIWKAANEKVGQLKSSCKPLSNYSRQGELGWQVLRASLRWIGTSWQHAAALQQLWRATTMISSVAVNFCTALPLEVATSPSQQQHMWWARTGTPHSQHPSQQRRGWHHRVMAIDIMEVVSRLTLCGACVASLVVYAPVCMASSSTSTRRFRNSRRCINMVWTRSTNL